jgi:hypothetical protein
MSINPRQSRQTSSVGTKQSDPSNLSCESKSQKGTVNVIDQDGMLRLRWRYLEKRYVMTLGLPDSKVNHQVAQQKATQIELDMASGNFDPSLEKYKPRARKRAQNTVTELFRQFTERKAKAIHGRSLEKYQTTLKILSTPDILLDYVFRDNYEALLDIFSEDDTKLENYLDYMSLYTAFVSLRSINISIWNPSISVACFMRGRTSISYPLVTSLNQSYALPSHPLLAD